MTNAVTSEVLSPAGLDRDFYRADVEVHGLDHAGVSYEGRIYLNNPDADETTGRDPESGYAGCFHIFGHGGCLGDSGHCDVVPRRLHDPRPGHPLTPGHKAVIATDAVRRVVERADRITITFVPVILSSTHHVGQPDDVVKFDTVKIVTYRQ